MEINEAADIWYNNRTKKNMEQVIEACDNYCYHVAIQKAKRLKREHITDDLFQQGRIGIWVALEKYNGNGNFKPYMISCMLDYMKRFIRKNYRINVSIDNPSEDSDFDLYKMIADNDCDAYTYVLAKELVESIDNYFIDESDYRRDILEQCVLIDDYRGIEIAGKYGVSRQAVSQIKEDMEERMRIFMRNKHGLEC